MIPKDHDQLIPDHLLLSAKMARVLLITGFFWLGLGLTLDISVAVTGGLIASVGYMGAMILHHTGFHRVGRACWLVSAITAVLYGAFHLPAGGYVLVMLTAAVPLLSLSFDWKTEKAQIIASYALIATIQTGLFYFFPERLAAGQIDSRSLEAIIAASSILTILAIVAGTCIFYAKLARLQRDRLADSLQEAREIAQSLKAGKQREAELYAVIGHELRTPAAALRMLLSGDEDDEQIKRQPLLASLTDQILGVIDTLKGVTQPDSLKTASTRSVSVTDLIQQQVAALRPSAAQHGVDISGNWEGVENICIMTQPQMLRQIISNLITNAIVHSGGSEVQVVVSGEKIKEEQCRIQISVEDNGRGIEPRKIEQLFLPFHRGDSESPGTGLGLSVSKDLAFRLGGDLTYELRPTGGSRFLLAFTAEVSADWVTDQQVAMSGHCLAGMTVLLAEDNEIIRRLTKHILEKAGASVALAGNGEAALEKLEDSSFDFVLSDIYMPGMNGYDLVASLRKQKNSTHVIGLTAAVIGEETQLMLDAGADAVLSKPVDVRELGALVKRLKHTEC